MKSRVGYTVSNNVILLQAFSMVVYGPAPLKPLDDVGSYPRLSRGGEPRLSVLVYTFYFGKKL